MPTVGRVLAAERARQGLELNDISKVTKLGLRVLRAIEADDFEQLPGLVFTRNFVRQYAEALNVDATRVLNQFDREQSTSPAQPFIQPPSHPHPPRMSSRSVGRDVLESNALSAFLTFMLTLAVCGALFYGFRYLRSRYANAAFHPPQIVQPPRAPRATAPTPLNVPVSIKPAAANPAADVPVTPPVPALGASSASQDANVKVDLLASEPCWVRITADTKVVFEGVLAAGASKSIDAANVQVRAGNAGALGIRLNGKDVPPLGPKGQIRTVVLSAAGAQVRTPTPEVLADF